MLLEVLMNKIFLKINFECPSCDLLLEPELCRCEEIPDESDSKLLRLLFKEVDRGTTWVQGIPKKPGPYKIKYNSGSISVRYFTQYEVDNKKCAPYVEPYDHFEVIEAHCPIITKESELKNGN